ncbi:MAG: hypothetical protein N3B21_17310 [Clostridia bacterium]|nr:hypothetical protein [Clostridia bacterium]
MDEKKIFKEINEMMEATDYPYEFSSVGDITNFLSDESNKRYQEQYSIIGRYYDEMVGRPQIDREMDDI